MPTQHNDLLSRRLAERLKPDVEVDPFGWTVF